MSREEGYKNLVPNGDRTPVERRSNAKRAGIASGVSRRRKKALREAADLWLSLPVSDRRAWNRLARRGVDPDGIDNQMAMVAGLADAATQGDAAAGRLIVSILGEDAPDTALEQQLARATELLEGIDGVIE